VKKVFDVLDKDKSNTLSLKEFKDGLQVRGPSGYRHVVRVILTGVVVVVIVIIIILLLLLLHLILAQGEAHQAFPLPLRTV
jgi:hypothetical protein